MTNLRKTPLWRPANTEETNMVKFMDYVNKKHGLHLETYDDMWRWSVSPSTLREFWKDAYLFLGIPSESAASDIGLSFDGKSATTLPLFPPPRFFPSQRLNLAEFIFRDHADDQLAIHYVCEGRPGIEDITWGDLKARTREAYDAMVNSGVKHGDKVAVIMSNSANAIVLCLATLAIGAIWASASPEMGIQAIVDRYAQIKPKIIFAEDAYVYAGKKIMLGENIISWSQSLKKNNLNLQDVIIVPYFDTPVGASNISHSVSWEDFRRRRTGLDLSFLQAPFNHPAFILFSSGTTGIPKCIVHSAGGVTLKVNIDSRIQHDMRSEDVFFQYTTTAWVMWVLNFVNLSTGGTMLLYNGSPFYPAPDILLHLAEELKVTVFGTSPRYLSELRSRHIVPRRRFNLSKLRVITSTGSVLPKDLYEWFYGVGFPPKAQLVSMSGGTDIAGSFVGGCPILPVYAGEIQAKCLGMGIDVFDSTSAEPISIGERGETGELVCTQPFPSQPLEFFGREGPAKYRAAYFSRFGDSVWCQGDFVQVLPDTNGILMMGRSDGVLNPSGVRFGSAEIYAVTETFPEVLDAICVGQRRTSDHDETVLLFLKMKEGCKLTDSLVSSIKAAIKERYSVRHVPTHIFEVADIPYTINGKKCEINVKQIVSGMDTKVSGTVANPMCLQAYEQYLHLPGRGKAKL